MNKDNLILDIKIKLDALKLFLNNRRYPTIVDRKINNDIGDLELYEKSLYYEGCHLISELIEKILQLLGKNEIRNKNHSLKIYFQNINYTGSNYHEIENLVNQNDNCFVETRYPDYYLTSEYNINDLLIILSSLFKEANRQGYNFIYDLSNNAIDYDIIDSKTLGLYNQTIMLLIEKYGLDKLCDDIDWESYPHKFKSEDINRIITIAGLSDALLIKLIPGYDEYDHKLSGTLQQKYAYNDANAKFYTLDWYLSNIDRIVYNESGENTTFLETNLSMNLVNKKSSAEEYKKNYIYYNACHLASEAIEKTFKAILLYNGFKYDNIRDNFGHSYLKMFDALTNNQKEFMYSHVLLQFSLEQIKKVGSKPEKKSERITSMKNQTMDDFNRALDIGNEFDSDNDLMGIIQKAESSEEWEPIGIAINAISYKKGKEYLTEVLKKMDKSFVETRYPEQYSVNFNYKYYLTIMLELLKYLKWIADIQYEIWRKKNEIYAFTEQTMLIAAEAHPEYEYTQEIKKSPDGEKMYRIK